MDWTKFIDENGVVTIPSDITKIAKRAFYQNKSIKEVVIPEGVTEIGYGAFYECTNLTKVVLPNSLKKIGDFAFENTSIKVLAIPGGLKKVSGKAFWGCDRLRKITVSKDNKVFTSIGNCCLSKDGKNLVIGCKSSQIPDSVICINEYAFHRRTGLKSITLPNKLQYIGQNAFEACLSLETVVFPTSLQVIDCYAFQMCVSLKEVFIPENVRIINQDAFGMCSSISKIEVSTENEYFMSENNLCLSKDGTTVIFGCCVNEDTPEVIVPNGVKRIEVNAFYGVRCKKIILPESLQTLEYGCFGFCRKLESLSIPEGVKIIPPFMCYACCNLKDLSIPETIERIEDGAFNNCRKLKEVIIPTREVEINADAFLWCDVTIKRPVLECKER